jgi:hypothetical protein
LVNLQVLSNFKENDSYLGPWVKIEIQRIAVEIFTLLLQQNASIPQLHLPVIFFSPSAFGVACYFFKTAGEIVHSCLFAG